MPSARFLTLIVSICHTVQAGRLSNMDTHLLRHVARNHGQNMATFKHGQVKSLPVQLRQKMRFRSGEAKPVTDADADASPYTFASPTGNGAKDFMTPYYGHFSHNYGPVYQLLTPVSGYGGFPATIDPRGFNAQTQNFTHGVFSADLSPPLYPPTPGKGPGAPSSIVPGLAPGYGNGYGLGGMVGAYTGVGGLHPGVGGIYTAAGVSGAYNAPVLQDTVAGIHAAMSGPYPAAGIHPGVAGAYAAATLHPGVASAYTAVAGLNPAVGGGFHPAASLGVPGYLQVTPPGLTVPGQVFHVPPHGLHTIVGQVPGTIPVMYPNGASKGLVDGIALRPAVAPGITVGNFIHPGVSPVLQSGAFSTSAASLGLPAHNGVYGAGYGGVAGYGGYGLRSPYNPSYSTGMMAHHQLTMNGAANGFGTPGIIHPMSDHYPTPDADTYHSVINNPVLPPNYGKENGAGSGSGAAK